MNIAELFVTLGVKGAGSAKKDISSVGGEMKGLSKRALGVFTAIAGISYGLSRLSSASLRTGNSLTKFANYTGQSLVKLQQWQYIAKQSGVAAEEVTSNVESITSAINDMIKTGQFSGEFLRIAEITNLDENKLNDTFYVLDKLKEFAKSDKLPIGQVNSILKPLLSDDMVQFLRTTKLNPENAPKWSITSSGQASALQKVLTGFENFQLNLEKNFGKVLVEVGPEMIRALNGLMPLITDLTKKLLELITNVAKFLGKNGDNTSLPEALGSAAKKSEKGGLGWLARDWQEFFIGPSYDSAGSLEDLHRKMFSAGYTKAESGSVVNNNQVTLNQNNYGVSSKDANPIADQTLKAVQKTPGMQFRSQKAVN